MARQKGPSAGAVDGVCTAAPPCPAPTAPPPARGGAARRGWCMQVGLMLPRGLRQDARRGARARAGRRVLAGRPHAATGERGGGHCRKMGGGERPCGGSCRVLTVCGRRRPLFARPLRRARSRARRATGRYWVLGGKVQASGRRAGQKRMRVHGARHAAGPDASA
ncbi:MAG: hypothetical protein J3K34DRAFT_188023 [Monoraphidium minutum]|nr:MAG: hypothetical protein J3K34DRAFT_188023 [Monoraphidium minutum]